MGQAGIEGEERGLTPPPQPEMMQPVSGIVPGTLRYAIAMQAHFPALECPALSQSSRETPLASLFRSRVMLKLERIAP